MQKPFLEVVRFNNADIIVTSSLPYEANPTKVSFGNWYAAYSVEVDQSGNTHDHPDGWYHFQAYRTDGADGFAGNFYRGNWGGMEETKYTPNDVYAWYDGGFWWTHNKAVKDYNGVFTADNNGGTYSLPNWGAWCTN